GAAGAGERAGAAKCGRVAADTGCHLALERDDGAPGGGRGGELDAVYAGGSPAPPAGGRITTMAIVRTPWVDDDGSGTTGTVINNAEKTLLYNQIDAELAKIPYVPGGAFPIPVRLPAGNILPLGAVHNDVGLAFSTVCLLQPSAPGQGLTGVVKEPDGTLHLLTN